MKKFVALLLILSMIFGVMSMVACNSDRDDDDDDDETIYSKGKASKGLEFELDKNNPYYIVTGIGTCTDKTVYIPETYNDLPVKEIGSEAFYRCQSFTKMVLPDSIQEIGTEAFALSDLESINLPDSIKWIGTAAFLGCNIKSITLPKNITRINNSCFSCCEKLTSITIPEGVTVIDDGAFLNCYSLKNVTLPNSLIKLWAAFESCTSLTTITIPKNVETVHSITFKGCTNLQTIHNYSSKDLSYMFNKDLLGEDALDSSYCKVIYH